MLLGQGQGLKVALLNKNNILMGLLDMASFLLQENHIRYRKHLMITGGQKQGKGAYGTS